MGINMWAVNTKDGDLYRDTEGFISFCRYMREKYEDIDVLDIVEKPWHWHTEWNEYQEELYGKRNVE